ncbi:hypothetical protein D3C85_1670110 [compost metagenome]
MQFRAGERFKVIAEAGQRDGIERQPRHVVSDRDIGIRALLVPFVHQPVGHAQHDVEVALHRALAERRHQDAVRLAPVGLVGACGE